MWGSVASTASDWEVGGRQPGRVGRRYKPYIIMQVGVRVPSVATRRSLHWSCPSIAVATARSFSCDGRTSPATANGPEPENEQRQSTATAPTARGPPTSATGVVMIVPDRVAAAPELYCIGNLPRSGGLAWFSSVSAHSTVGTGLQYWYPAFVQTPTRAGDGAAVGHPNPERFTIHLCPTQRGAVGRSSGVPHPTRVQAGGGPPLRTHPLPSG